MQKSRLQGPSTFHSVLKGPRFISNSLRPRSEPRKAVPEIFQSVPFLKTFWAQGNWSPKRLTWNILYNDKVETVFAINYGTQFSKKNSSIQNGSISIGRSNSRIAFWVSERGPPFEPQFCAQKWRNRNLGEEQGKNPSLLFRQGCPCVKVWVLVS